MENAAVDLYWLPLGAGGRSVRVNGQVFETVAALLQRRKPSDLYHSALVVEARGGRYVIEQAPAGGRQGADRGVVGEGPVGSTPLARLRLFRYEVRRWRDGVIPDVDEAVDSPQRLTNDPAIAQRILELVPQAPTPVWGRDECEAGEMWNSNSLVSWLLERSGVGTGATELPAGGRAPGWDAGVVVARRRGSARGSCRPSASRSPGAREPRGRG